MQILKAMQEYDKILNKLNPVGEIGVYSQLTVIEWKPKKRFLMVC